MVRGFATLALGAIFSLGIMSSAMAAKIAGHPRVNEVNQRLSYQQHRIAEGIAHGQINRWQAMRDERRDARVERQLGRDEAMHDGHISVVEQNRMNRELDRNSVQIYDQRH